MTNVFAFISFLRDRLLSRFPLLFAFLFGTFLVHLVECNLGMEHKDEDDDDDDDDEESTKRLRDEDESDEKSSFI